MRYAFRCRKCGHLHHAAHAGENLIPFACCVCGAGVIHTPNAVSVPENWEVLADATLARLEESGLTEGDVGRHIPAIPSGDSREPPRHLSVQDSDSLSTRESLAVELTPAVQVRDWRQRWGEIQADLNRLRAPRAGGISAESVQAARHELHSFFVQAYHLKDALKLDSQSIGVSQSDIEDAITHDPALALVADLANLDKHGHLSKPPRSGHVPAVTKVSGVSVSGGWSLSLSIQHGAACLDGLSVAKEIVSAWEKALRRWGII